ncbi:hypothetical protein OBBRIDRAFT_812781 [Obba rivulosa]|uniref:Uncharacterized protein n=1 Tax=Obba rivulosa TaxID=1052685 RepID=A0A8E2DKQ4_9APHY|nr:hypothetical protein OBBRIDRAFT_812781 [Obba rivulosa]
MPVLPSIAISLQTLELYHCLCRQHPQLSVQPMVKAICNLHNTTYSSVLREQFSAVFDVYLDILHCVQTMVDNALSHSSPDWWAKNICPCCNLKLAIGGNNSAKQIARAGTEDERIFHSKYFLFKEEVDRFKDEVKCKVATSKKGNNSEKTSAAEHKKCALEIYENTGIFVSACRHGLIQKACEMVCSRELAKYLLAITNWILNVHGNHCGCKYDIRCMFNEMANNSNLLSPKVCKHKLQFVVCTFHSYAHNRLCQLYDHPLYITGYRIEDLEEIERVFSVSNTNEDKYAKLSRFLYNNYRQCLTIIKDFSVDVAIEAWISDVTNFNLYQPCDVFVSAPAGRAIDTWEDMCLTCRLERACQAVQEAAYATIEAYPKYQDTLSFMCNRDFHYALEQVQWLVVQHLLELSKMCTFIWKVLKARGKAIQSALSKCNALAALMIPPAPTLEWKNMQADVLKKPWTIPYNCEVVVKYWKIYGAFDEIERLNVEVQWLYTDVAVRQVEFKLAIEEASKTDQYLAAELRAQYSQSKHLDMLYGFTECLKTRVLADSQTASILQGASSKTQTEDQNLMTPDEDDGDQDDDNEAVVRMTDFLEDLAIRC